MATDFVMPRMPTASRDAFYQQPQQQAFPQLPPYHQQYPYPTSDNHVAAAAAAAASTATAGTASNYGGRSNPQISPLSTSNNGSPNSPNSPKSVYHTRQVRPLYIPAVLRPTEHPSREVPKGAANGSGAAGNEGDDNGDANGSDDDASSRRSGLRSSGSFISLPGFGAFGIGRLSRRSTNDSGKCVDATWNLDLFPEVKRLPSRDHWKPDPEATMCDEPTCKKYFNYFTRRHHCRRCGNIFCDLHSAYEIPLDEKAKYNPRGAPSRSCAYCFREFKAWRSRTNSTDLSNVPSTTPTNNDGSNKASANNNINNSVNKRAATAPTSPVMALSGRPGAPGTPTVAKVPDVAQSVPGDWNWSTF
ncbi:fyve domain containing protein [Niveomyces insectorum RCEF 264]|uniref:Fyve domain containing protein n=1 Tax=Niveomyces insectorum RCEF 264 TaxID=1081102 RepID=A0A167ZYY7_9HYPO|nr:fyve domain containing protein [Niveomyces insectorum RCEF 264]